METLVEELTKKVTSYNIFNNLLPGIAFCYILSKTTRFNIAQGTFLENIFVYYFVGMILSRIGSLVIERILKSIKYKNGKFFIDEVIYENYIHASEKYDIIKSFMETNNLFRTSIAVCIVLLLAKLYDWLIFDKLTNHIPVDIIIVISFLALSLLFVFSYKKQTNYIKKRVDDYIENP